VEIIDIIGGCPDAANFGIKSIFIFADDGIVVLVGEKSNFPWVCGITAHGGFYNAVNVSNFITRERI
jgi:hypothetical protein